MTIPTPPRTQSDEWARVIRKAHDTVPDHRRSRYGTDEVDKLKASAQWKALPITIGMAIGIVTAVAAGVGFWERVQTGVDAKIERMIASHTRTAEPHPYLSADMREEVAKLSTQLGRMEARIEQLAEKLTREKRR